ncbi:colicin immunity domain-containing protein [Nocardia sp. NPDC059177]|uniref:colicin immunity domain-containing protein n=1 Tax=Nocardia sp. NPDC059177 TaxID=3346759 RepID=UPI0036BE0F36
MDLVDRVMGKSAFYQEVGPKKSWMRRDYGLVELNFNPDPARTWTCFGVHVRVHRLQWGVGIPEPIVDRVSSVPREVRFTDLTVGLGEADRLTVRPDRDFADSMTFRSSSGAEVVVTTDDSQSRRVPDLVWSIDLATRTVLSSGERQPSPSGPRPGSVDGGGGSVYARRTWARREDVPRDSGVGEQISLMDQFAAAEIDGAVFARGWLAGRRRQLRSGERVRAPIEFLLNQVFYELDEYAIDRTDLDEGDVTEEQLRDHVREIANRLR